MHYDIFKDIKVKEYIENPILDCLAIFCKMSGRPYSKESLIAGLPIEDGHSSPVLFSKFSSKSLFSRAAAKAGFKTRVLKTKLEDINPLVLPCIVLLNGKNPKDELRACILLGFDDEMANARIVLPEAEDVENSVTIEELKKYYFGFSILLKKELRFDDKQLTVGDVKESHWLWGTMKIVRDTYRDVIIASLLINIFVLATPLFTMNVYDRVIPNDAKDTLWILSIGVLIVYGIDVVLKFLRTYFLETAGKKTDIIASSLIFERVLDLKMSSMPSSVGSMANILKEFESIRSFITSSTISLLIDLPFIIIFLITIYYIGGVLVVVPIIIIIFIVFYTLYAKEKLQNSIKQSYEAASMKNGVLIESLSSIETLKSLGATGYSQWKWEEATSQIADKSISSKTISASITTVTSFLLQLNTVAIIIVGTYLIGEKMISMGALIAVVIISSRAISPMGQVASLLSTFHHTKVSYKALDDIMNMPVEHPQGKKFVARPEYRGNIEFKNVGFTYPNSDKSTLNNINFTINEGEHIAIIGKIGSGKSTIHKLLLSLYVPNEGAILIDNIDTKQLDPTELRKNIAYVSQDVLLFNGTVKENIVYRLPHIDDEKIIEAATVSGVMDFINKHPKGFDMPVGERGAFLSGGQRQSIAIARAILQDYPIVLLDEPTSAMDSSTESKFMKNIKEYLKGKTMILVTHKTSLLSLADRIIVMEDGQVVLDGKKDYVVDKLRTK
ncbi:type I secretion system permease/ATPase [Aliarcobacter cryaerophilus ATCC 43158]|uniref:Type I secretion system ATPase/permease, LssB family n=1 Tax=Aliarcobacter cryaerophilus ATCC 43158 TaxID=1032070 RepID=A0AAD0TXR4_9BACT|nr:type I secretion system permease/ATPase [Aliarcobacter cryaerophilus]AYJ80518.1 type I secretion system ATPase/permease, LssB family [Aliarcobacter cryaerophilus ATCC 43158]PRM94052.1 type I secretion system permease/ATPase [Aliarcobacter cryaerophilus]QCZ24731.1 type I secretion system permease/ATPase [Aliarcobacter cryaerophilus ATCC 43158]